MIPDNSVFVQSFDGSCKWSSQSVTFRYSKSAIRFLKAGMSACNLMDPSARISVPFVPVNANLSLSSFEGESIHVVNCGQLRRSLSTTLRCNGNRSCFSASWLAQYYLSIWRPSSFPMASLARHDNFNNIPNGKVCHSGTAFVNWKIEPSIFPMSRPHVWGYGRRIPNKLPH